jgi:hypothetical protein
MLNSKKIQWINRCRYVNKKAIRHFEDKLLCVMGFWSIFINLNLWLTASVKQNHNKITI